MYFHPLWLSKRSAKRRCYNGLQCNQIQLQFENKKHFLKSNAYEKFFRKLVFREKFIALCIENTNAPTFLDKMEDFFSLERTRRQGKEDAFHSTHIYRDSVNIGPIKKFNSRHKSLPLNN